MRVFKEEYLTEIYCNKCGKQIDLDNGIIAEGVFSADYKWGYFSNKDGVCHKFDLCEKCYDEITSKFKYPLEESGYSELI
jgi:hypothetical protein